MNSRPLRVPERRFFGEAMSPNLGGMRLFRTRMDAALDAEGWTGRRVLGMKIPEWQREPVWSLEQCALFVESVYLGAGLGQYMLNECEDPALSGMVLDGQQRLLAIERYWDGAFGVPDESGRIWLWSDLDPATEQARFDRIQFPWLLTRYESEAVMKDAYNRHNWGGTPHRAEHYAGGAAPLSSAPKGRLPR